MKGVNYALTLAPHVTPPCFSQCAQTVAPTLAPPGFSQCALYTVSVNLDMHKDLQLKLVLLLFSIWELDFVCTSDIFEINIQTLLSNPLVQYVFKITQVHNGREYISPNGVCQYELLAVLSCRFETTSVGH